MATRMQWIVRDERGSIMVSGLMLVFIMTLIGSGIFTAAVFENRLALGDTARSQGFYIAEAGLNTALRELTDGDGTNDFAQISGTTAIFTNKAFGTGSFTVTVQTVTGSNPQQITVTSTACLPAVTGNNPCPSANTQATVQSVLIFQESLAGSFVALNTIQVDLVDSFDSTNPLCQPPNNAAQCYDNTKCVHPPPFTQSNPICDVTVRANGCTVNGCGANGLSPTTSSITVSTLYGNILDSQGQVSIGTVHGTVTYDQVLGSCPNCDAFHVTGGPPILAATPTVIAPPVVSPCTGTPPYSTSTFVSNNIPGCNTSQCYNQTTGDLTIKPGDHFTIMQGTNEADGNYCFHSIDLKGLLDISGSVQSPVVIYVSGTVKYNSASASINNLTFKAEQFQLLSSCNTTTTSSCGSRGGAGVIFNAQATGYMYVYAPQTNIQLGAQANLFGAILGYDIQTSGQPQLHYDKALGSSGKLAGGIPKYTWNPGSWKACKNPQCT